MAKAVNQHKAMAMGSKKQGECKMPGYRKGGMVDCGCPGMDKPKPARGKK